MKIILKNIGVIGLSLLLHLYFYQSEHIKKFDYKFYDLTMMFENEINKHEDTFYTVIVDIDEKSLHELGQWPWPRVIDAQLINIINKMNPSGIGVNILFPEEDRVSPIYIQNFYQKFFNKTIKFREFPEVLKDNDKLLWNSIYKSNATIATYLINSTYTRTHCEDISYKNNIFAEVKTTLTSTSFLCNHESIQHEIENFGFINAWRDSDGIFRRVPLFMSYKEQVFPSFALATLLSFDSNREINKEHDTVLVKFTTNKPKVFSALDILGGKVSPSEIQGKIVIVGSSVVGLDAKYTIANGEQISKNMIHAFTIDNILANSFLTQPEVYKKVNLLFSFLLSLLMIVLFSKKRYIYIVGLFSVMIIMSFIWLFNSYLNGIYISIGYLWIPFVYFFAAVLIYHIRVINQEKQQQENLLIRQSKLASMGEMISLIAHQWRQPLSVINGIVLNIDVDQRKKILHANRLDEHLNKIEETTEYLSKTINDFTDFFSKNKGKETFYISDVLNQAEHLTGISNHRDIEIIYLNSEEIEFVGYKSELIQSVLIVLNNAIHACLKNLSTIEQGKILIDVEIVKEHLLISIEDNGGGIDMKDLKKIFDPYFTTKAKQQGTGLGLYILKLIIEDSMNGRVTLHNGKEGAVFTFKIPMNI